MDKIGGTDIIQINIVVRDIEKTVKNYVRLFGIEMPKIKTMPPYEESNAQYRGKPCRTRAKMCSFKMGAVGIELIEPDDEPSVWKEFLDKKGEGVCYLGLYVENSAETLEFLKSEGVDPVHWGGTPTGNWNSVDAAGLLGVMLNIKQ